jgi:hypothetical protein
LLKSKNTVPGCFSSDFNIQTHASMLCTLYNQHILLKTCFMIKKNRCLISALHKMRFYKNSNLVG